MLARLRTWHILIALAVGMAFAVLAFPASWARALAGAGSPEFRHGSLSGPWWNGRAENVTWRDLNLGTVEWQVTGAALREGRPALHLAITAGGPDYALTAHAETRGADLVALRAIRGEIPAGWLVPPEVRLLAGLTGRLDLDLDRVLFAPGGLPRSGQGKAVWRGAGVSGMVRAGLGTIDIGLEDRQDMTVMELTPNEPAEVNLRGSFRLTGPTWDGSLRLEPAGGRHPLTDRLAAWGEPLPGGGVLLPLSGRMEAGSP